MLYKDQQATEELVRSPSVVAPYWSCLNNKIMWQTTGRLKFRIRLASISLIIPLRLDSNKGLSKMAKTAITFGILLTLLGLIAYFGISSESITALIPAFFGVPVIILGWLALNEKYRKHSMHIAAALMLLGFIGTGMRVFPQLFGEIAHPSAFTVQLIMTLLCLIFIILAVKSFIEARRNREN